MSLCKKTRAEKIKINGVFVFLSARKIFSDQFRCWVEKRKKNWGRRLLTSWAFLSFFKFSGEEFYSPRITSIIFQINDNFGASLKNTWTSQIKLLKHFCQVNLYVCAVCPDIKHERTEQIIPSLFHSKMLCPVKVLISFFIFNRLLAEYFPLPYLGSGFYERILWKNSSAEKFSTSFQVWINHYIQRLTLNTEDLCAWRKMPFRNREKNN